MRSGFFWGSERLWRLSIIFCAGEMCSCRVGSVLAFRYTVSWLPSWPPRRVEVKMQRRFFFVAAAAALGLLVPLFSR